MGHGAEKQRGRGPHAEAWGHYIWGLSQGGQGRRAPEEEKERHGAKDAESIRCPTDEGRPCPMCHGQAGDRGTEGLLQPKVGPQPVPATERRES